MQRANFQVRLGLAGTFQDQALITAVGWIHVLVRASACLETKQVEENDLL